MRYSTKPKYRKYVKGFGFLSFAKTLGDKDGKILMNTATKTGRDAVKTASKWVVQKTAEATGDLIGNKTVDKITSLSKTKSKQKEDERQEIYTSPAKRQQIIDLLKYVSLNSTFIQDFKHLSLSDHWSSDHSKKLHNIASSFCIFCKHWINKSYTEVTTDTELHGL